MTYTPTNSSEWHVRYHGVTLLIQRLNSSDEISSLYRVLCGYSGAYATGSDLASTIQEVAESEHRWLR
jgi:hypothetical protein